MKILGIGVCGSGEAERYLDATLKEFRRLCDDVLIVTNNAGKGEIELIERYQFQHYEDNREWGIHQPDIKTALLKRAEQYVPDWIIALDMDETFAPEFDRKAAEELTETGEIAYNFLIVNLYNDESHFAHSTGIQRFWNIRFYKFLPSQGLEFQKKALHCGLGPPIMYVCGWHAPYYVLHYGLMKPEDRLLKAERYRKYDPNKRYKAGDYYDDLVKELKMIPFDSKGLLEKLKVAPDTQPRNIPKKCQL